MVNFLNYSIIISNTHPQMAEFFGSTDLSYQEVSAILGIIGIIGGVIIKIFYKPDDKLASKIQVLETKIIEYDLEAKEKIKDLKEQINRLEGNISDERDRDNQSRDKAIEKIENRIEKLSDYIMKLIEKL